MLSLDEIEQGAQCTHKNTGLRYSVVEVGEDEVLLSAEGKDLQDLVVPTQLFLTEFVLGDRYHAGRGRGRGRGRSRARRAAGPTPAPTGPKSKGRIKKMVRDRGFGFIRGEDGKEVFIHRSAVPTGIFLDEGDKVEYEIEDTERGPSAKDVKKL